MTPRRAACLNENTPERAAILSLAVVRDSRWYTRVVGAFEKMMSSPGLVLVETNRHQSGDLLVLCDHG